MRPIHSHFRQAYQSTTEAGVSMRSRRRLALGVVSCAVLLLGLTGTLEAASKRQSAALDATSAATRGASEPLAYETASVITRKSARLTLFDAALVSIGRQPVDQAVAAAGVQNGSWPGRTKARRRRVSPLG